MSNTFFTSDTHYGHANIASRNGSRWKEGFRNDQSLDEMNKDLVSAINKTVKHDDVLYHLGDWSFGGIENIWKFRKQLNCKHIHLILGNHDHHIEENAVLPNVQLDPYIGPIDKSLAGVPYIDFHAQALFDSVGHYKEVRINGKIFVLSHYAHRVWHGSHKGWMHLYAHSHDSLPPYGKSHDIGVDTALRLFGVPRPFSVPEVVDLMDKLPLEFPDHHDLSTNTGKPQFAKK